MDTMQDEIHGEATDRRRVIVALGIVGALAVALAIVLSLWPNGENEGDEGLLFGEADLAIILEDEFAVTGDGQLTPAADAMLREIQALDGVDDAWHEGPSTISGIVPDAPTLSAYGHRLLVELDGWSLVDAKSDLLDTYGDAPGVEGIAVPA